jgi:predicted nucleotidyltransferase
MSELAKRQEFSKGRLNKLRGSLSEASKIAAGKACVYVTGSFGRLEASEHSDLDVFIAGRSDRSGEGIAPKNLLNHLDEICLQAELIKTSSGFGFPKFTGDGRYLDNHSIHEFTSTLGTERDDVTNTFTARLLLLLESKSLVEEAVYTEVVREVIKSYWRDYADHSSNFMPAFLANDILRLWRTFCVNYEARTERKPDFEKAKGKLKNYKLKHSRILTCYSALLYLLQTYVQNGTVSPDDAIKMVGLTPICRLKWLRDVNPKVTEIVQKLLDQYDRFLTTTNATDTALQERFANREVARSLSEDALTLGNLMFSALGQVGNVEGGGSDFYRLLVV